MIAEICNELIMNKRKRILFWRQGAPFVAQTLLLFVYSLCYIGKHTYIHFMNENQQDSRSYIDKYFAIYHRYTILHMSTYTRLVSVIIPTKNDEKTLTKCLFSIKQQSYQNIEIIVIDGFSTDQ